MPDLWSQFHITQDLHMTDLAKIIQGAVTDIVSEERIKAEVTKRVDALLVDVIKEQMRSYGDLGNLISDSIKESLKVTNLDLPSYGTTVTAILRKQIEETVAPIVAGKLAEDMEALLNLAPKTIKLSAIVKDMLESSSQYDEGGYDDLVSCIVRETEYGHTYIYLDEREHYSEAQYYQCKIKIFVGKDGRIISVNDDNTTILGKNASPNFAGRQYGTLQKLQAYYACGTTIEIDEDEVVTGRYFD